MQTQHQQTLREDKQNDKSNKNEDETNQRQSFVKKGDRSYKQKGDRKCEVWLVSRVQSFPYWEGGGVVHPNQRKIWSSLLHQDEFPRVESPSPKVPPLV